MGPFVVAMDIKLIPETWYWSGELDGYLADEYVAMLRKSGNRLNSSLRRVEEAPGAYPFWKMHGYFTTAFVGVPDDYGRYGFPLTPEAVRWLNGERDPAWTKKRD